MNETRVRYRKCSSPVEAVRAVMECTDPAICRLNAPITLNLSSESQLQLRLKAIKRLLTPNSVRYVFDGGYQQRGPKWLTHKMPTRSLGTRSPVSRKSARKLANSPRHDPTPRSTRYLAKHRFGQHRRLLTLCSARDRYVPPMSDGRATPTLPRPAFQPPDQDPLRSAQTQHKRTAGRDWPVESATRAKLSISLAHHVPGRT